MREEESAFLYSISLEITLCFRGSFEELPFSQQGVRGFANHNFLPEWMFLLCNRMARTLALFSLLPHYIWTHFLPTFDQFLTCYSRREAGTVIPPSSLAAASWHPGRGTRLWCCSPARNECSVGSTFWRHQQAYMKVWRAAQPALLETALGEVMLPTAFLKEILASPMLSAQGSQAGRQGWARNCPVYSSSSSSVPAAAPTFLLPPVLWLAQH